MEDPVVIEVPVEQGEQLLCPRMSENDESKLPTSVKPDRINCSLESLETLEVRIKCQIEYYFSIENLKSDTFLRRVMNSDGWVPFGVVCDFRRAKMLCKDIDLMGKSICDSSIVELSFDKTMIRTKIAPEKWPIGTQLKANAPEFVPRNDVEVRRPASTSSAPSNTMRRGLRSNNFTGHEFHRGTYGGSRNASAAVRHDLKRMKGRSDENLAGRSTNSQVLGEHQCVPKQTLRVIQTTEENVSSQSQRDASVPPPDEAGNRAPQVEKSVVLKPTVKGASIPGNISLGLTGQPPLANSDHPSGAVKRNQPGRKLPTNQSPIIRYSWLIHGRNVDGSHPARRLLGSFLNLDWTAYISYHDKCINERDKMGPGKSFEMATLYRFWAQALRIRFYQDWYTEFVSLARIDQAANYRYGIECLFYFYSYGLEKNFMIDIYRDFEMQTIEDYESGHLYGLEKFWAFLKYSGRSVVINWKIQGWLNKFQRMEDFRGVHNSVKTAALARFGRFPDYLSPIDLRLRPVDHVPPVASARRRYLNTTGLEADSPRTAQRSRALSLPSPRCPPHLIWNGQSFISFMDAAAMAAGAGSRHGYSSYGRMLMASGQR